MKGENTRYSRRVAVGLLLAFVLLAGVLAIGPIVKGPALNAELALAKSTLRALEARVMRDTRSADAETRAPPPFDGTTIYLPGSTMSIASARLQDRIIKLFNRHGGRIKSARVLSAGEPGNSSLVAVRLTAIAGMKTLRDVLYDIETSVPILFVDAISITVPRRHERRRPKPGPIVLKITIEVSGYRSGGPVT